MDGKMVGWVNGYIDCTDGCMDRWIDGWMGVGINGWKISISETIPARTRLDLTKFVVILG
jgi:hypothetical protein